MATTMIVTDSAADIPPPVASRYGIRVVPLEIRFGSQRFTDGQDLTTEAFWRKLRSSPDFPSTAAPSAGDFEQLYRRLVAEGADGIVSVHLSSKLSATYQAALMASREVPEVPIHVVDSLGVSAMVGLLALAGAELARQGATAKEVAEELEAMRARTRLFGTIDTLEFLRRGGRIGRAQSLLGTMLQVKPIITFTDGVVDTAGKVRTRQKALAHLVDLVARQPDIRRLVVLDGDAPDLDQFLEMLRAQRDVPPEDVWMLGPVVGTHAGPGVVGIVFETG